MTSEVKVKALEDRMNIHEHTGTQRYKIEAHERREMRGFLGKLNENLIYLTAAMTEWKTRDAMFDKAQQKQEAKIENLTEKHHSLELRVNTLEGTTKSNTKAKDVMIAFWLKISGSVLVLALIGGLTYKLVG